MSFSAPSKHQPVSVVCTLQQEAEVLILDLRDEEEFAQGHLMGGALAGTRKLMRSACYNTTRTLLLCILAALSSLHAVAG